MPACCYSLLRACLRADTLYYMHGYLLRAWLRAVTLYCVLVCVTLLSFAYLHAWCYSPLRTCMRAVTLQCVHAWVLLLSIAYLSACCYSPLCAITLHCMLLLSVGCCYSPLRVITLHCVLLFSIACCYSSLRAVTLHCVLLLSFPCCYSTLRICLLAVTLHWVHACVLLLSIPYLPACCYSPMRTFLRAVSWHNSKWCICKVIFYINIALECVPLPALLMVRLHWITFNVYLAFGAGQNSQQIALCGGTRLAFCMRR